MQTANAAFECSDTADTSADTRVTIDVLANDSDPDGDPLSVIEVTEPRNGTAIINADDTITYTPNAEFTGTDRFWYTISDGKGGTDMAAVTITVSAGNAAPVAADDSYSTDPDTPLSVPAATGGLVNDSDVDGDAISAVPITGGATARAFRHAVISEVGI